jgi:hypothetical protein
MLINVPYVIPCTILNNTTVPYEDNKKKKKKILYDVSATPGGPSTILG